MNEEHVNLDNRLDRIENNLEKMQSAHTAFALDIKEFVGKASTLMEEQGKYLYAANERLEKHIRDERTGAWKFASISAVIISTLISVAFEVFKK